MTADEINATKHDRALKIVFLLREMLKLDPIAVTAMITTRWQCNEKLANHATIQSASFGDHKGPFIFGILSLLNGLVGVDTAGLGCIAALVDCETNEVTGFTVLEDRL